VVGRNTQGVRIMDLREGDKIASIAKIAKEDVEETQEPVVETPPDAAPETTAEPPTPAE
jgi:DNA gyrase subunit A